MNLNAGDILSACDKFEDIKHKINLLNDAMKMMKNSSPVSQELFDSISELSTIMEEFDKNYGSIVKALGNQKIPE